jgi:hypothetical protein
VESSKQISADLKSILLEKHLNFELLNTYKGVPFICKAVLEAVEAETVRFALSPASPFAWGTVDHTLILSEGLLEPIEARLQGFDQKSRALWLDHFVYAGSKLSNRKELRVEPGGAVEIMLEADGEARAAHLADLSMRGAGVRVAGELPASFAQGKVLDLRLRLPEGALGLAGKIRNLMRSDHATRLSLEFIGTVPDKTPIVRFIMRRRAEIMAEMQKMAAWE